MASSEKAETAAVNAIRAIGRGYDVTHDLRLSYCKGDSNSCLIQLHGGLTQDATLPGGIIIPSVSKSIKCDKGERMRFRSDVLPFQQVDLRRFRPQWHNKTIWMQYNPIKPNCCWKNDFKKQNNLVIILAHLFYFQFCFTDVWAI